MEVECNLSDKRKNPLECDPLPEGGIVFRANLCTLCSSLLFSTENESKTRVTYNFFGNLLSRRNTERHSQNDNKENQDDNQVEGASNYVYRSHGNTESAIVIQYGTESENARDKLQGIEDE